MHQAELTRDLAQAKPQISIPEMSNIMPVQDANMTPLQRALPVQTLDFNKQVGPEQKLQDAAPLPTREVSPPAEEVSKAKVQEEDELEDQGKTMQLKEDSGLASVFQNDTDVEAPAYNVEDFYWTSGCAQKVA